MFKKLSTLFKMVVIVGVLMASMFVHTPTNTPTTAYANSCVTVNFIAFRTVRNNNTNFRAGPGTNFASLGQVHAGTRFHVNQLHNCGSPSNSWMRGVIQSGPGSNGHAGRTGWIRVDMLQ